MTETLQSSSVCHTRTITLAHAAELLLSYALCSQSVVFVYVAGSFWVTMSNITIKAHAGLNASAVLLQHHDSLDYCLPRMQH